MDKCYIRVFEQLSTLYVPQRQRANIQALMDYELLVLDCVKDKTEIINAYEEEEDKGIYVLLVDGELYAANNRRAMMRFIEKLQNDFDASILMHKLGSSIDFELHNKIADVMMV